MAGRRETLNPCAPRLRTISLRRLANPLAQATRLTTITSAKRALTKPTITVATPITFNTPVIQDKRIAIEAATRSR